MPLPVQPKKSSKLKTSIRSSKLTEIQQTKKLIGESLPKEQLKHLGKIASLYGEIGEFQQMKYYAELLLQTAQKLDSPIYIGAAYLIIGGYFFEIGDVKAVIEPTEKALEILQANQFHIGIYISYKNLGNAYDILGNYETALHHYLEAKTMNEAGYSQKSVEVERIDLLNRIGAMYVELNNFQKGFDYYNTSYELLEELEEVTILPKSIHLHTLRGLACSYSKMNQPQLALHYLDKLKAIVEQVTSLKNRKRWLGMYYGCMGDVYYENQQVNKALSYYELSLENSLQRSRKYFILIVISKIGDCYLQLKQYDKALQVLQKGFDFEAVAAQKALLSFYEVLHKVYLAFNNFKDAYYYLLKFTEIKEELMGVEQISVLEKLEQQIEKERQEKKRIVLELKALRAQMNPHFIFNSLNAIQYFIADEPNSLQAQRFLADFALLIRKTLEHSEVSFVSVEEELNFLQSYLSLEQLRLPHKFDFFIEIDDTIDIEMIEIPPMLLQPYMENALLHGILPKKGKGRIHIQLTKSLTHLIFVITDNGIGRAAAQVRKKNQNAAHKSMGMEIQTNRFKALNALFTHSIEVQVTDLWNEQGRACGTQVKLQISLKNIK